VDPKIKAGLEAILESHFDEMFRGELYFPRFRLLDYERVDDRTYKAKLELIYMDCHNDSDPLIVNDNSIFNPVLPSKLIHLINIETISWDSKEAADVLNSEPSLIDFDTEIDEVFGWDDLRISDDEVSFALSLAGFDKFDISEDSDLKAKVEAFLNSEDMADLDAVKSRLRPFLS